MQPHAWRPQHTLQPQLSQNNTTTTTALRPVVSSTKTLTCTCRYQCVLAVLSTATTRKQPCDVHMQRQPNIGQTLDMHSHRRRHLSQTPTEQQHESTSGPSQPEAHTQQTIPTQRKKIIMPFLSLAGLSALSCIRLMACLVRQNNKKKSDSQEYTRKQR